MFYQVVKRVALFLWLSMHLTLIHCSVDGRSCDPDSFYRPYVIIKRQKNGAPISSLHSTGFLDLRTFHRVILCINGPAVLYSDVDFEEPRDNATITTVRPGKSSKYDEFRFREGVLNVYNHECLSINKVLDGAYKKNKSASGRKPIVLDGDSPVVGQLVLGVYLIGHKDNYRTRELVWFKAPNFDFVKSKDKTVKATSFIVVNSKSPRVHACIKLSDGTNVRISTPSFPDSSEYHVCRWTPEAEDAAWYAQLFQKGFDSNGVRTRGETMKEKDYTFWECPDADVDRDIIITMGKTTAKPDTHVNWTEFDPFSIFNPNKWTPHGYRVDSGGLSGGDERPEDQQLKEQEGREKGGARKLCSLDKDDVDCIDSSEETSTLRDMQNVDPVSTAVYELRTSNCINFPTFFPETCTCKGDNARRILEVVMELEPLESGVPDNQTPHELTRKDISSTVPPLIPDEIKISLPKWGDLGSNKHLKWKQDVLYTVAEIFENLCMPFRREFPYQVARVFGWYVLRAHAYGENLGRKDKGCAPVYENKPDSQFDNLIVQPDMWVILQKELLRCRDLTKSENEGRGFKFQWEVAGDIGKWKVPSVNKRKKRSMPVKSCCSSGNERTSTHRTRRATNLSLPHPGKRHTGKPMSIVNSEGNSGYVRETIQEYREKPDLNDPRQNAHIYCEMPENLQHCWDPQEDPVTGDVVCSKTEDIFFYEDRAEVEYELNIAIDLWWKIWATTIGYCNKAYISRKSETFPRLYNSMYEYFFELVMLEWKHPQDNGDLKYIFSEYLTEESRTWLDACVEAGYINSNSQSYRPPRPMTTTEGNKQVSNFFDELPAHLFFKTHGEAGQPFV